MVLKYLNDRQSLFLRKVHPSAIGLASAGYAFLIECLFKRNKEITPEFTRSIELLEHLLFSFIEHAMDPEMLSEMKDLVDGV